MSAFNCITVILTIAYAFDRIEAIPWQNPNLNQSAIYGNGHGLNNGTYPYYSDQGHYNTMRKCSHDR